MPAPAPLCVAAIDPASGAVRRSFFFLGDVPPRVLAAARSSGKTSSAATLQEYYGRSWRAALTPQDLRGGATGGDAFSEFDDAVAGRARRRRVEADADAPLEHFGLPAAPVFSELSVHPDDTLLDLRNTLFAAGGPQPYRGHLFYGNSFTTPYRVTLDSAPVATNWREMLARPGQQAIAGLALSEAATEERRSTLAIEMLDDTTLLRGITRLYYVDFHDVLPPLPSLSALDDKRAAIAQALRDAYRFDLLYYGAIVRYWPQLSPAAARAALSGGPEAVAERFPLLAPSLAAARDAAAATHRLAVTAAAWRPPARDVMAVTALTIAVSPAAARLRVTVRNAFDSFATTPLMPAAAVSFGGVHQQLVGKRHVTSYDPRGTAPLLARFFARPLARDSVAFALAAGATLEVAADGRYTASMTWREDDRLTVAGASAAVAAAVAPAVAAVNACPTSFPLSGKLGSLDDDAEFAGVSACFYWPRALSTAEFAELRRLFTHFATAATARASQHAGMFSFAFTRGVVSYPPAAIGGNQYAWLTDETAAARWGQLHSGRLVRVSHRVTDLRVEILDAGGVAELESIRRYVFAWLDDAAPKRAARAEQASLGRGRLRRLQERDPELFDLKKHDPNATVYSVLCQSARQPIAYDEAEAAALPPKRAARLTRYRNFTDQRPAFYECPDPAFPHLGLRRGAHPLGYCLPCCKKAPANQDSQAAQATAACLARWTDGNSQATADVAPPPSRHVLTYGKTLEPGRVSEAPPVLVDELFFDAIPAPLRLLTVGVAQASPAVPDAGFAFALAGAVADDDSGVAGVFERIATVAAALGDTYASLGGGAAAVFESADELAAAVRDSFAASDDFTAFSPGGPAGETWSAIVTELVRLVYEVEIVTFVVASSIELELSEGAAAAFAGGVLQRLVVLLRTGATTYYLAAADPSVYLRTRPEQRWMITRRVFVNNETQMPDRVFEIIAEMAAAASPPSEALTLDHVTRYALTDTARFALELRLVGRAGLCYGVLLKEKRSDARVYLPVPAAAFPVDGTPAMFGPRPASVPLPKDALERALADIPGLSALERREQLVSGGHCVGFAASVTVRDGLGGSLFFFHDPAPLRAGVEQIAIPYDPREIDEALLRGVTGLPPRVAALAAKSTVRNMQWQLLVTELATLLRDERNRPLRARLAKTLRRATFATGADVAALSTELRSVIREGGGSLSDVELIRGVVADAFAIEAPTAVAERVIEVIGATAFEFDRTTLAALREAPDALTRLREMLRDRVDTAAPEPASVSNMYVSCASDPSAPQCSRGRLALSAPLFKEYTAILAETIRDPTNALLITSAVAGVCDPLDFVTRGTEHVFALGTLAS